MMTRCASSRDLRPLVWALLLCSAPAAFAQSEVEFIGTNGVASDQFGASLDLQGDTLVIGSRRLGPNPSQGYAIVYRQVGGTWQQEQKLTQSGGADGDAFGIDLALDGGVIAVGAFGADVGGSADAGVVVVFRHDGQDWIEEQVLSSSPPEAGAAFGSSVALDGDVLVVGASLDDAGGLADSGSATVFRWNGASWVEEVVLLHQTAESSDWFGEGVAIDDGVIAVNSWSDDVGGVTSAGSVHLFRWDGAAWAFEQLLTANPPLASNRFGDALDLHGDVLVVGTHQQDVGVNPNQGTIRIFRWNCVTWASEGEFSRALGAAGDEFGYAVAADEDTVVAGSRLDDVGGKLNAGSLSVFRCSGQDWVERQLLSPAGTDPQSQVGFSVAVDGDLMLGGAPVHDVGGTVNQGAAWLLDLTPGPWTELTGATAGVEGSPELAAQGTLVGASPVTFTIHKAPPSALMLAWVSFAPVPFAALGGTVQAHPFSSQVFLSAGPFGGFEATLAWPTGVPAGTQLWLQMLVADASTPHGVTLSNGLLAVTP